MAEALQSPEARLYAAGFTGRLDFWCPPGEDRALILDDAVAMLDAGEVHPPSVSWPGVHPDALVGFQAPSEEEIDQMLHPPPRYRASTAARLGGTVGRRDRRAAHTDHPPRD